MKLLYFVPAIGLTMLNIIVCLNRELVIINYGLRGYESCKTGTLVTSILAWIVCVMMFILKLRKKAPEVEFTLDRKLLNKVDEECKELARHCEGSWRIESGNIAKIIQDVMYVEKYYAELGNEVKKAGCVELSDADDILHSVLTAMSNHVTQLLRVMRVLGTGDTKSVHDEIVSRKTQIRNLKTKAEDFVTSVLKYMGDRDGDDSDAALAHISSFKEIILGELDLADKYS